MHASRSTHRVMSIHFQEYCTADSRHHKWVCHQGLASIVLLNGVTSTFPRIADVIDSNCREVTRRSLLLSTAEDSMHGADESKSRAHGVPWHVQSDKNFLKGPGHGVSRVMNLLIRRQENWVKNLAQNENRSEASQYPGRRKSIYLRIIYFCNCIFVSELKLNRPIWT